MFTRLRECWNRLLERVRVRHRTTTTTSSPPAAASEPREVELSLALSPPPTPRPSEDYGMGAIPRMLWEAGWKAQFDRGVVPTGERLTIGKWTVVCRPCHNDTALPYIVRKALRDAVKRPTADYPTQDGIGERVALCEKHQPTDGPEASKVI